MKRKIYYTISDVMPALRKFVFALNGWLFGAKFCNHLFKANEMQPRDSEGNVKWECCKCKKMFVAECGLDILRNGRCDGRWDLPNKYLQI